MATKAVMKLKMRPAQNLRDFMVIRCIRNSCREFMTKDKSYIGPLRQILYYARYHMSDRMSVLYIGEDELHRPIAYGLISYDDTLTPWVSGGLLPRYRGKGYGRDLFKFLSEHWQFPVYLEVLETNHAAWKLYNSLGFVETQRVTSIKDGQSGVSRQETVITMRKVSCSTSSNGTEDVRVGTGKDGTAT